MISLIAVDRVAIKFSIVSLLKHRNQAGIASDIWVECRNKAPLFP